jgi:uncharacterized protein YbcV (DUF1398 family)
MAKDNNTKVISMLVCFAGKNRRIEINPKKAVVDAKAKSFTYKAVYKADDGKQYIVSATSIAGTEGAKANVVVTNRSDKQTIAERQGVDVRFHRYLF